MDYSSVNPYAAARSAELSKGMGFSECKDYSGTQQWFEQPLGARSHRHSSGASRLVIAPLLEHLFIGSLHIAGKAGFVHQGRVPYSGPQFRADLC